MAGQAARATSAAAAEVMPGVDLAALARVLGPMLQRPIDVDAEEGRYKQEALSQCDLDTWTLMQVPGVRKAI